MHILITDLNKDRAALRQQFPRHRQPVPQIRQVGVDPIPPSVSEGFHLLRLSGDVLHLAVPYRAAGGGPLKVGVELDAVGWIDVHTLNLAPQPFPFRQRCHNLQAVTEDHPVRPVGVVLVELRLGLRARQSVEVGEKIGLETRLTGGTLRFRILASTD